MDDELREVLAEVNLPLVRMSLVQVIEDFVDWQEDGSREDQIEAVGDAIRVVDALLRLEQRQR